MLDFDSGVLVPIFSLAIPVVAIVGGITAGIVRMVLKARMMELAQRERIAAIERGVDISKLQPLPGGIDNDDTPLFVSPRQVTLNRSRGLLVGGIVTLAVGIGLGAMLGVLNDGGERVWAVGLIPALIGVALLISAMLIRRAADEDQGSHSQPRA
jgi:hypothetical protein